MSKLSSAESLRLLAKKVYDFPSLNILRGVSLPVQRTKLLQKALELEYFKAILNFNRIIVDKIVQLPDNIQQLFIDI
jgi:hypothetical protein